MSYWIAIIIAVGCNVIANVCIKRLSLVTAEQGFSLPILMQVEWPVLAVSGAGLLGAYAYAVKGLGLPVSYTTVTAGAMVLLLFVSAGLFDTHISRLNLAGAGLVIIGIVLLAR